MLRPMMLLAGAVMTLTACGEEPEVQDRQVAVPTDHSQALRGSPLCAGRPLKVCATIPTGPPIPTGFCKETTECYSCLLHEFELGLGEGREEHWTDKMEIEQEHDIFYNCTGKNDNTCPMVKENGNILFWRVRDEDTGRCGPKADCTEIPPMVYAC